MLKNPRGRKRIIFFTLALCITITEGRLNIPNHSIDFATKTFPFDPINLNSTAGHKIGTVYATDINDPQKIVKYSLIEVSLVLPNGSNAIEGPASSPDWKTKAKTFTVNDCSEQILKSYPEFRKYFCIDHDSGVIKTTTYFEAGRNKLISGSLFKFVMFYKSGPFFYPDDISPFSARVISNCDSMTYYYNNMTSLCDPGGVKIQNMTNNDQNNSGHTFNIKIPVFQAPVYLSLVKVDLTWITNEIEKLNTLCIEIIYNNYINDTKVLRKIYNTPALYYFEIDPPMKVEYTKTIDIKMLTSSNPEEGKRIFYSPFTSSKVLLFYLEQKDFCTSRNLCVDNAIKYYKSYLQNAMECQNEDYYLFVSKYNYCLNNPAPVILNTTAVLDLNKIENTRQPVHIISNYIHDNSSLRYKIRSVVAKYEEFGQSVLPTKHPNCTAFSAENTLPSGYFCINEQTGSLFTTSASTTRSYSPDEVFNITIFVEDYTIYPPRDKTISLQVSVDSLCKATHQLYREYYVEKNCDNSYVTAEFSKENNGKFSLHNFVYGNGADNETNEYYIVGLSQKGFLQRQPLGSYRTLILKRRNTVMATKNNYIGAYSSFNDTLRHTVDMSYDIVEHLYDITTNSLTQVEFAYTTWQLHMINDKDYCTNNNKCILNYEKYKQQYENSSSVIDKYCADPDFVGAKVKYGRCSESQPIAVTAYEYNITISKSYSRKVIIPGTGPMYTPVATGFIFNLRNITWEGGPGLTSSFNNVNMKSKECNNYENLGWFCIDRTTGHISTIDNIEGTFHINDKIYITVRITQMDSFPKREVDVTLTVKTIDQCSNASNIYQTLSSCVNYGYIEPTPTENPHISYFTKPNMFQAYLSMSIDLKGFKIDSDSQYIRVLLLRDDSTEILNRLVLINLNDTQPLSIPLNDLLLGQETFRVTLKLGYLDEININITANVNSILIKYMISFKCDSKECIDKYVMWKYEASKKAIELRCTEDPDLYGKNFEACLDPQPSFPALPHISTEIQSASTVTLSGCFYKSPYEMDDSYWLKNGYIRLNSSLTSNSGGIDISYISGEAEKRKRRDLTSTYPNLPDYKVNDLVLKNVGIDDQGYYQCVVASTHIQTVAKSDGVFLKLIDVSETRFSADLPDELWNGLLTERNSLKFQNLQKKITLIVEKVLDEGRCCGLNSKRKVVIQQFSKGASTHVDGVIYFTSVTASLRLDYCQKISILLTNDNLRNKGMANVQLTSTDCCFSVEEGDVNFKGEYIFNMTLFGTNVLVPCQYGSNSVIRDCAFSITNSATWSQLNLTSCLAKEKTTQALIELADKKVTTTNVEETANALRNIVQNGTKAGTLNSKQDIRFITNIVQNIVSVENSSEKVTNDVLDAIDEIFNLKESLIVEANNEFSTSSKLLQQLDILAENQIVQTYGDVKKFEKTHMAMLLVKPAKQIKTLTVFSPNPKSTLTELQVSQNGTINRDGSLQASITLPQEVLEKMNGSHVYSFIFRSSILFQNNATRNSTDTTSVVQSVVMSASMSNGLTVDGLSQFVSMTFAMRYAGQGKNNKTGSYGSWSTEGCKTRYSNYINEIICECNHLTNFAILLDVDQSGSNPLALQVITWIGCGISLAGLLLTLISFTIIPTLRKKLPSKILICLSISLMSTLLIFLFGVEKTEGRQECQAIAILLHYFLLTTFFWMAVEALNLYRNFVKVFRMTESKTRFLVKISLFAWGIPLIIVAATAGAAPSFYGPETKEHIQFCVIRGTPFYLALLLPVASILVGNIIVLILVLNGIKKGSKISKDQKKQENQVLAQARIAFACSTLLGVTWVFGVLAIGNLRDFFQWLFCIFNSLQGFFIFLFYCLRSQEVRKQWVRCFGGHGFDYNSSSTMRSKDSSKYNSAYKSTMKTTFLRKFTSKKNASKNKTTKSSTEITESSK